MTQQPSIAAAERPPARFRDYVAIARPDHWPKHVFILPGIVLAYILHPTRALPVSRRPGGSSDWSAPPWRPRPTTCSTSGSIAGRGRLPSHQVATASGAPAAVRRRWSTLEYMVLAAIGLARIAARLVGTSTC